MIKSTLSAQPQSTKLGAALVSSAAMLLIALVGKKIWLSKRKTAPAAPLHLAAAFVRLAPVVLIVLGGSVFIDQRFPLRPLNINSSPHLAGSPNILWIVMDTVRADHLSVYGYERDTTPNLKKLSGEATLYLKPIAPSDLTLSSHASMFTGLYPSQHGAHYFPDSAWGRSLAADFHTLAEILAEKGYSTISVAANHVFLGPGFHLDQGFRHYEGWSSVPLFRGYCLRTALRPLVARLLSYAEVDEFRVLAGDINRSIFHLLDELKGKGEPFYLFINYMDAHRPYLPPPPYDSRYPGKDESLTLEFKQPVLTLERGVTERERQHLISQ
jgi:hypothetical protein